MCFREYLLSNYYAPGKYIRSPIIPLLPRACNYQVGLMERVGLCSEIHAAYPAGVDTGFLTRVLIKNYLIVKCCRANRNSYPGLGRC
jgi:hypothetical protein